MTRVEARIVLGLKDDDVATKEGLEELKAIDEKRINTTLSKSEKSILRREIKAIDKLLGDF